MFLHVHNMAYALLYQFCLRYLARIQMEMLIVVIQDQPVDVDLGYASMNAASSKLVREAIRTVKYKPHTTIRLLPNRFQSTIPLKSETSREQLASLPFIV